MIEQLVVKLIGDGTSYQRMMANAQKSLLKMEVQYRRSFKNAGKWVQENNQHIGAMGRTLTAGVTAPLAGMGAAAVNEFAKFDKAMTESTSIMKTTEEQVARMRDTALTLSSQGTQGPDELARSYFFLASAGLDAEQAMLALPKVQKFATAGAFDMALATDLLTDAQSALGLSMGTNEERTRNMARVANVLVKANTLANASVEQFSISLTNTAGSTLKNFNKTVEEGVAVLAAYADQGVKAQVAGTNLTRITLLLQKAALKEAAAHKELNFHVYDGNGKMRNYADIIENLEDITAGMTDETKAATLAQLGFQARVQNAILPLIGQSEQIRVYQQKLEDAGGTVDTVANKQLKAFSNQMTILWNQIKVLGILIGETFVPVLESLSAVLSRTITWMTQADPTVKAIAVSIAALAAAIGPVVWAFSSIVSTVTTLTTLFPALGGVIAAFSNPLTAIGAILIGAVVAVRLYAGSWKQVGVNAAWAIDFMTDYLIYGMRVIGRSMMALRGYVNGILMSMFTGDFISGIRAGINVAMEMFKAFFTWMRNKFIAVFTGSEVGGINDMLDQIERDYKQGASGDLVGAIGRILKEEGALLRERRAPLPTVPNANQGKPVETTIVDPTATDETKDIKNNTAQMVDKLQQLLDKEVVQLEGAGL